MSAKGVDFLRQFIAPFMQGKNIDALLGTLGAEDERLEQLTVAVNDQLTISTASEEYLDKKAADLGIARPSELGMEDLSFRNMVVQVNANKQITEVIHTVLATFYGDQSVRGYAQSGMSEPFQLQDGMDLAFTFEDGETLTMTFNSSDFLNITSASAQEVCDTMTRFIRSNGYQGYALPILDADTGKTFVRIFGSAKGPYSFVQILGGKAQTVFQFPFVRATELTTNDTIWEITRNIGSTLRFRWTGVGSAPLLDRVFIGDKVLIYGSQFESSGLSGTYLVTNVRPAIIGSGHGYNDGWFEIEKLDFTGLRSSEPGIIPPINQPATSWSNLTTYTEGQIVTYSNKYWESLQSGNVGNQPDVSAPFWIETSNTGVYYSITLSQNEYKDLMFFNGKRNTPYINARYSLAWEPARDLLKIYLPATTNVVKRDLAGAAHMHALYAAGNMDGSFGSTTAEDKKIHVLSPYSVKFPQSGFDNIAFGGTMSYDGTDVVVDYAQRENGYTTVVCQEEHGITGITDSFGRTLSNTVISLQLDRYNTDDSLNPFVGPYIIDPGASYALSPNIVTCREKVFAGESRTTLFVKGYLPNERGQLWFGLNQDNEEGPVTYFASQVANAPTSSEISSISQNEAKVTVITITPHGAIPGSQVLISGTVNFNGIHIVKTVPSPVAYTFEKSPNAIIAENTGTSATLLDGIASTALIDPSYNFKHNHDIGEDVTLLEDNRAYEPLANGTDYSPYITGTADGRIFVEELVKQITAIGIRMEIIVVYPNDVGLGNMGLSKDDDDLPHSEAVEVWGQ